MGLLDEEGRPQKRRELKPLVGGLSLIITAGRPPPFFDATRETMGNAFFPRDLLERFAVV